MSGAGTGTMKDKIMTPNPAIDPIEPDSGAWRIFRGGSYYYSADRMRSAYRDGHGQDLRVGDIGFRVVRGL